MIKNFLKKIFKTTFYNFFLKVHGKIEKSITENSDDRIEVSIISEEKNLSYKVYKIKDARIYTDRIHDTAVILDNKIINGPSFQLRYTENRHIYNGKVDDNIVFQKGTPRIMRKLNNSVLSLLTGGAGNSNYWHWMFDVLPRLNLCNKFIKLNEIDYFLLPSLSKKFQIESLNLLNIPNKKRISSEKFRHVKVKKLIVTDHPVVTTGNASIDIQNIPRWITQWLKESFVDKNSLNKKENIKKVFIERKINKNGSIPFRFIENEEEVKACLLMRGFRPVILEDISFKEQISLFQNADCIVGLHGAGFANLSFCNPGIKVIELRSHSSGSVIENLAKKLDLNYFSLVTKSEEVHKFQSPNQQGKIRVSIKNLIKLLEN